MPSQSISISVDGSELWNSLNLNDGLRFSPKFQLALRTCESELECLQDRYKEAIEMFHRTQKAGINFADSLNGLCQCLKNAVAPNPALANGIDCSAELQSIIRSIYTFSNTLSDFSSRLQHPSTILQQSGTLLDELLRKRREFHREGDQVVSAINKAAGVPRNRHSDAEDADSIVADAKSSFARIAAEYLSGLRLALGSARHSTVLNVTLSTFEIQQRELMKIHQTDMSLATLRNSINAYDLEKNAATTNGHAPLSADQAIRYEGYLFKRSKKKRWRTWVRCWFMVSDNRLVYFSSLSDSQTHLTWKVLEPDLRLCTAKTLTCSSGGGDPTAMTSSMTNISERRYAFELISPSGKVHHLQAESAEAMEGWVSVLRSGLLDSSVKNNLRQSTKVHNVPRVSFGSLEGATLLDELSTPGNRHCADCLVEKDVTWASTNLGVTLCTECASFHRNIGVHISKVRSLLLDNWEPEIIEVMRNLGNNLVAKVYESDIHAKSVPRPKPGDADAQIRRNWIEAKWAHRAFVRYLGCGSNAWLLELYRAWWAQVHFSKTSPASEVQSPQHSGTKSLKPFNPLQIIDRRKLTAVVRASMARAQVMLDGLCAHLDILTTQDAPKAASSSSSSATRAVHSALQPPSSTIEDAAARLVMVAGSRLGCAPLILAGLSRGACPNALPVAAEWGRAFRLPSPADGDPLGATTPPLVSAVTGGRIAACELLLSNGADINAVDALGRTALHHACSLQRVHLVCLLLRRRANQDIRDKSGRRPLDVAMDTAHADIVTLLRLQHLHSNSNLFDRSSDAGGQDDTAVEVFRDFTSRAYHLEWDSEEEDYHEPSR